MSISAKKTALAAISALALVIGGVGTASAFGHGGGGHAFAGRSFGGFSGGHSFHAGAFGHHRGFGRGAFFGGLAVGALAAAPYAYDYGYYGVYDDFGPECYLVRRVVINRWGYRVIRRVRVCD